MTSCLLVLYPIDLVVWLVVYVWAPQLNMKGKVIKALMSIEGLPQSGWLFQNESFVSAEWKGTQPAYG